METPNKAGFCAFLLLLAACLILSSLSSYVVVYDGLNAGIAFGSEDYHVGYEWEGVPGFFAVWDGRELTTETIDGLFSDPSFVERYNAQNEEFFLCGEWYQWDDERAVAAINEKCKD